MHFCAFFCKTGGFALQLFHFTTLKGFLELQGEEGGKHAVTFWLSVSLRSRPTSVLAHAVELLKEHVKLSGRFRNQSRFIRGEFIVGM